MFYVDIKEHLAELLTHLSKATAHWFNVGLFLNVDYGRLKSIRHENPHSQSNCLREMLAAWLHKTEDASPMKVAFALKESKLVELAYEFASKYGKDNIMFLSESCDCSFASTGKTALKIFIKHGLQ